MANTTPPKNLIDSTLRESLLQQARHALSHSYAPYSKFRVAAAVLTDAGEVFTGVNVENASYGLTNCAERSAIFTAVQLILLFTWDLLYLGTCHYTRQSRKRSRKQRMK